jgi:two-component system phosphate regulon sensor histidine kinase PhoR
MMIRSIHWRIAIPFIILTIVTMAGLGWYVSAYLRQTYLANLEDKLTVEARLVADDFRMALASGAALDQSDGIAKRWAQILNSRITLIAADGEVLGESHEDRSKMDNHLNRPEVYLARINGTGTSIRFSDTVGYNMMYTAMTIKEGDRIVGIARVAVPLVPIEEDISRLQRTFIGTTVLVTVIVIALALFIAGRTTHHLRELTQAADQLAAGELSHVSIPTIRDEVSILARSFNTMAEQLHTQLYALKSESSKLAAVLRQMTDGVLIVDEHGRVQLVNPTAERMFGIKASEVLGHSLAEVLRYHQFIELWQRCREVGELQETSLDLGFNRLSVQGVAIPLGESLPGHILLLFQDVTRLRQLETVRRDFVSNISHELRTPLASLKALTETLQESALDDPPAARRFLQRMETEVDSLSLMVSELIELVRIESGRVPLQLKPTSPLDILKSARERLVLQAERAGLTISLDCPADLPAIMADPPRIEQVVVNLLHNAIKFTPSGGQIHMAAKPGDVNDMVKSVTFSVQDTGVGISTIDLPRIFERFYKADRARSGGGTGLGLAIARHTVEAHGGRIWAESIEGQGSTFAFSLPVYSN